MSHRLQFLIPEELNARIENAAQRCRTCKGAWVRRALEAALERRGGQESGGADPLLRLVSLGAPTADINDMIAEIGSGRS
jgi:hypothetical protein